MFFKPFAQVSVFSVVTTSLPLLIGCICGLIFMPLGYQFTVTCIEVAVIEVLEVILMVLEKRKL